MCASLNRSANQPARRSPRSKAVLSLLLALPLSGQKMPGVRVERSQQSVQGLTIIECLVAIVVIAITIVAITPPIMLATASRIQSRKVEKANQVAQGEIDRVKLLVERGTYQLNDLPATPAAATNNISSVVAATAAPSGSSPYYILSKRTTCAKANTYPGATPTPTTNLVLVDVDGDCDADYAMQVFRTTGFAPLGATEPYSFVMGVRVYAYYPNQPFISLDTTKASVRMGTGPLDLAGGKRRPMAVLYSAMARNDSSKSLGQLCVQTGGTCTY